ncbi:MAG: DUF3164 family protein [Bacteroidales bacterium]|jgi:hypothetical protein|nr:DUF3164 family protein [Bacteroidales bacterium]
MSNLKKTEPAEEQNAVLMTAEEMSEYSAFRAEKQRKAAEERRRAEREIYRELSSGAVDEVFPELLSESRKLSALKQNVYNRFHEALELKREVFGFKTEQRSHTFINADATRRIRLGDCVTDDYDNTVEEGIAIVRGFLDSLSRDERTKTLVNTILRLLSRDLKGNLKASRVIQLRRTAEELGEARLLEGVRIIEESYRPAVSKQFVRAEYRNEKGEWVSVPLGMTES